MKIGLHLGCGKKYLKSTIPDIKYINIDYENEFSTITKGEVKYFVTLNSYYLEAPNKGANKIICDKYDDIRVLKNYKEKSISEIIAFHVLEHFVYDEGLKALKRWSELLEINGCMRIIVPDIRAICARVINSKRTGFYSYEYLFRLLYGSHNRGSELDGHKSAWTEDMITNILGKDFHCVSLESINDNEFNPSIYIKATKKENKKNAQ